MPEENLVVEGAANEASEAAHAGSDGVAGAADVLAASGGGDVWYSVGSLIDKGGPIVAILLVLSVISLAVILLKVFQFWSAGLSKRSFVDPAVDRIEAGDDPEKVEEDFREVFETENPFAEDGDEERGGKAVGGWWRKLRGPRRDPEWHDM